MGKNDTILGIGTLFEKRLLKPMVWILPLTMRSIWRFLGRLSEKDILSPLDRRSLKPAQFTQTVGMIFIKENS